MAVDKRSLGGVELTQSVKQIQIVQRAVLVLGTCRRICTSIGCCGKLRTAFALSRQGDDGVMYYLGALNVYNEYTIH